MSAADENFRLRHRLRVRWAEVDLQQVVFNGHYLMYFDTAVAEYWRALGLPYQATMAGLGGDFFVRKAGVDYHASACFDDALEVGVRCARVGRSSMTLACAVWRGEERLVDGELVYVFVDAATRRPLDIPPALRAVFEAYEAGAAMVEIRQGGWAELGEAAHTIRHAVFVDEQHIPAELEWDAADASAHHALAVNRLGLPLATARLVEVAPGVLKLGRMAVIAPMRGSQVGRQVLQALVEQARARGATELMLHAQRSAIGFYRRTGFVERGPAFEEAGIAHQEMVMAFGPAA